MEMKHAPRWLCLLAASAAVIAPVGKASAADPNLTAQLDRLLQSIETKTYARLTTIQVPGQPLTAFDISAVDRKLPFYYLADRSNGALDIFDTRTNTAVAQIFGFVGVRKDPITGKVSNDISGPDGVAVVGLGEVWVGDGDSTVKVVDVLNRKIVATISTALPGQTADQGKRADEMAYDPKDHVLLVANNAATPPFVTFISTKPSDRRVLGHIVYSDAAGVEASVYDPVNGLFYVNLTQVGTDQNYGQLSVINARSLYEVSRSGVYGCNATGIALAPGQKLLIGCSNQTYSLIVSAKDGSLIANIPQTSGSDQVVYNPGDNNFYLANRGNPASTGGPSLGIINAATNAFVANVPANASVHSVDADPRTNHIYVPSGPIAGDAACANGCIEVFAGTPTASKLNTDVAALLADLGK